MSNWQKIQSFSYILASQSPRRHYLLKELGLDYKVSVIEDVEEVFPEKLKEAKIAEYLARHKAKAYKFPIPEKTILITADTIVWHKGDVINKPDDESHAIDMIKRLSGDMHQVFTGVCIKDNERSSVFSAETKVFFNELQNQDIDYYVKHFKPLDKAGAYGIQEWIGYIGIERIEGSYWNVMGLPVQKLYTELVKFIG